MKLLFDFNKGEIQKKGIPKLEILKNTCTDVYQFNLQFIVVEIKLILIYSLN